jgi:hypothetical protein
MNAKERRTDRRRWKYSVRYNRSIPQHEYDIMWDWCVAQWGRLANTTWRERFGHVGTFWQFENEQAMTLFILRFGAGDVVDNDGWMDYD